MYHTNLSVYNLNMKGQVLKMMERIRQRLMRAAYRYNSDVRIRISLWVMLIAAIIYFGELATYGFSEMSNRFWEFMAGLGCGISITLSIQVNRDHDREREEALQQNADETDEV